MKRKGAAIEIERKGVSPYRLDRLDGCDVTLNTCVLPDCAVNSHQGLSACFAGFPSHQGAPKEVNASKVWASAVRRRSSAATCKK